MNKRIDVNQVRGRQVITPADSSSLLDAGDSPLRGFQALVDAVGKLCCRAFQRRINDNLRAMPSAMASGLRSRVSLNPQELVADPFIKQTFIQQESHQPIQQES